MYQTLDTNKTSNLWGKSEAISANGIIKSIIPNAL